MENKIATIKLTYMPISEAMSHYGVSRQYLYQLRDKGLLRFAKLYGRAYILRTDLAEWHNSRVAL